MVDHLVNVNEDVDVDDVVFENIGNIEDMDGVEFDENIGNGEDMNDVDFKNILDQDSSDEESILSDDVGFTSDASEYETDIGEKFILAAEIRALNDRTKYCMIQSYYTTGDMENHERVERELLEQCDRIATLVECFAWLQRCDECIERLEELCRVKRPRLTVGHRQSAVARIARLAGAKSQLERRFVHVGGEYAGSGYASSNEQSLVWREIDAAFESHILTGAVINFNHIEPRRFLEDAREIVLERVRDAVERVPREITTKRAVISVRTTDNACFAWSVVAALHPAEEYVYRESSYPHYSTVLNFVGIEFPMTLKDIVTKFEHLNAVSINVYGIENKQILPLRLTSDKKEKHINLLYLQDPRDDNVGHFTWIKNLSRLVRSQLTRKEHKKYFCDRCLHYFGSKERLQTHEVDCRKINDCTIRLPSEDDRWLEFGNHRNQERVPFVVYADLECVLQKTEPDKEDASYTYQRHKVCSVGYYVRCSYDNSLSSYHFRRDENCITWFTEELGSLAHRIKDIVSKCPWKRYPSSNGRRTAPRRVATFARSRSRQTIRGSAIIAT
ncbi:hypothetical protein ALC57_13218 [Trachymyrmex cornetzi]|uniref:C2H2-type domain-containing protein n=1 Tax=Trachymyrmex cornetzi TaxID=471704 RepID=A0A151IZS1_9HYME|nr:hypothetical protein ALC57_13218 [Trachymyrmex cornetzi]